MRYAKQGGIALLNTCLAIAVAALLAIVGVRSYQSYKKAVAVQGIAFDLQRIWQVGMDYYTSVGCVLNSGDGESSYFAGDSDPSWDQVSTVTGEKVAFSAGREPWVSSYQLRIERKDEVAGDGEQHAHYHLVVVAKMQAIEWDELQYLAKRLHATAVDSAGMELDWDRLAFALRGSLNRRYQPLQANNMGDLSFVEQDGETQANRQYCR